MKGEGGDKPYVRLMKKDNGKDKATRFIIGVDSGKEAIMYATSIGEPGPRYMHYPKDYTAGYDMEYFRGLISEKMVIHRRMGQSVITWEKTYERNEPLDCRNYARAAYKYFNWNFDKMENILNGKEEKKIETRAQIQQRKKKRVLSEGVKV